MENVNKSTTNNPESNNQTRKKEVYVGTVMPTMSSGLQYLYLVGPSTLVGFFVLLSIFNQNLKGLAYLVGICVLFTLSFVFGKMMAIINDKPPSQFCSTFGISIFSGGLSQGTLIYMFTLFYLLFPMIHNNIVNMPILFTLIFAVAFDGIVQLQENCTTMTSILFSLLIGVIVGSAWSVLIYSIQPELVYHTDYISNNKLACSMPSKQKFKCVVKKNGEIIG